MNIKSLLLGSAAALVAVSGARAADAVVVAEPEPAEYVRICDVYGAGYFYIPGTEICLRIGGYVRYDIGVGDVGAFTGAESNDYLDDEEQSTYYKNARFTVRTYTGQETELGTLRTYTETRFNWGNDNAYGDGLERNDQGFKGTSLNFAWMQLGGLRVGKDESAFLTFHGYLGNVINDTLVPYGGFDTNVVQYYFDFGNGFSAVASLETGAGNPFSGPGGQFQDVNPETGGVTGQDSIDSYVPYVVGGVKWTQGWGAITALGAYNSSWEEWAGKVKLDVTPMENLSLFLMVGYGTDDNIDRNFYKQWGGNWAIFGGGTYTINEKTSFNTQLSYDEDENYGIAANIAYEAVPGFVITAEVDYAHDGQFDEGYDRNWTNADDEDSIGGMLRFQRSF
ncbi:porin [Mesorhizobium ventifaucium]|uniref:Porin n=1 Tax=Mesorhizobium ventifaucium TaxID=666020 RepID=A0ABM9DI49_9HYPH|nr:porin [Mesorhizobium ventifaucium]CAH2396267.1 Porin Omp2b [Mesorhizobium ventifaucium]